MYLTAQQAISDRQDSTFKCGVAYGVRAMVAEEDRSWPLSCRNRKFTNRTQRSGV